MKKRSSMILTIGCLVLAIGAGGCLPRMEPTASSPTASNPAASFPTASSTPRLETVQADLRDRVEEFRTNLPRENSNGYTPPNGAEQAAFVELTSDLLAGDLAGAALLAGRNDYTLVTFQDEGENLAASYLLLENPPIRKGWGMYALRMEQSNAVIIEAPHPITDTNTALVAVDLYRALQARALLIAGAHRNANQEGTADVAHIPESIFQSVHDALLAGGEQADGKVILQLHGFSAGKHPGFPEVVIGFSQPPQANDIRIANQLAAALASEGIHAGTCEDDRWKDLCGTKNVQAATSEGASFLHLELNEQMRENDRGFVAALVQIFSK